MANDARGLDGIVTEVIVAEDDFFENFVDNSPGEWIQTSFNTHGGKHYNCDTGVEDDGTPLRKNYAGIGYTYDRVRDAFISPQKFPSWTLNKDTCKWEPPTPRPDDYNSNNYTWNETDQTWDAVE